MQLRVLKYFKILWHNNMILFSKKKPPCVVVPRFESKTKPIVSAEIKKKTSY